MYDDAARSRLVEKIAAVADGLPLKMPLPVVSVHDFMDGNDDRDSLAVNVLESQEAFRALRYSLVALAKAPGIIAVLVEIHEIRDGAWPFSERVYVVASEGDDQALLRRCEALKPTDIAEGWFDKKPPGAPDLLPSDRVLSLWWD